VPSTRNAGSNHGPSKYDGVNGSGSGRALSYGQIDGNLLRDCVEAITAAGDAILFGRTSDGGALSLHVLSNGSTIKLYPADASMLQESLESLIRAATAF
jgi:hypothetical protein